MTSTRIDREGAYHRAVLEQLRLRLPGAVVHHSPNEFPGKAEMVARAIAKAKKNGMIPGFPDLVVFWRGQVALVEVKAPGGKLSASQKALHPQLEANGFAVHIITEPSDAEAIAQAMRAASDGWQSIGDLARTIAVSAATVSTEAAE